MTKIIHYEQDILLNILKEYPLMDSNNIYKIIEDMIYKEVEMYYKNGSLKCKYTLRFGMKDGLYQSWWDNGQKQEECYFLDCKKEGMYQAWWSNGQKRIECHYRNGEENGIYQVWYNNGKKSVECYYREGKQEGLFQYWFEKG